MSLSLRPEVQALVRVRPVFEEFARSFAGCGLYARFYQAEPAPVVGTTKCPESLCLTLVLPSSGRRVPPPPRTLLPVPRSYGLMRQSRVALLYFGFWPCSWSLRRLLPAPAATGILPTLSLQICPRMPGPLPRRSHRVHLPVSSSVSSAFPRHSLGRLPVGTICVNDAAELVLLDYSGMKPFVNPSDPDSYREDFSRFVISPEAQRIGAPWRGRPIRPVGHISDLITRWALATNPDLSMPAECRPVRGLTAYLW
jgi:hypothetical protein